MSDISSVVGPGAGRLDGSAETMGRVAGAAPAASSPGRIERPSDRVELSDRARLLSKLASLPEVRQDLVDRVKREIEDGGYDTPERMDSALNSMIDDLDPLA